MNVLVIPEDFRKDQYILKPIIKQLFTFRGKPQANVRICNPPLLQGVTEALKSERIADIVERYPFVDLFLLCVDRDGLLGRRQRLDQLEKQFNKDRIFLAVDAWEELETWLLAGLTLPTEWSWQQVRNEVSVKEIYFDVLARNRGVSDGPGGGRKALGLEASRKIGVIIAKCQGDFGELDRRIKDSKIY